MIYEECEEIINVSFIDVCALSMLREMCISYCVRSFCVYHRQSGITRRKTFLLIFLV